MGLNDISKKGKKLWDEWNLQGCILLSLCLQVFLVLFASSRKRCKNSLIHFIIWATYLLADWVAAFAIGLIIQSQFEAESNCAQPDSKKVSQQEVHAFWASFLLLHLGGPDTITSFSLEDNEFWIRHLFGLALQVLAAAFSISLTLPNNRLSPPTFLVFIAGIVKYAERTRALYLASLDHFGKTVLPKPEPGRDYEQASTIYFSDLLKVPIHKEMMAMKPNSSTTGSTCNMNPYSKLDESTINTTTGDLAEIKQLKAARVLFERFKGLIVGFLLTSEDRESSRDFFLKANFICAFRVIEYELHFMFQVLHTKAVVLHQRIGYIFRIISFVTILAANIYYLLTKKDGFGRIEIILTYALLAGAFALESISVIMLIFSDWTLVLIKDNWTRYVPSFILKRKRWSRLVSQYNIIDYCLDEHRTWLYKLSEYINARDFLDYMKIMRSSSSYGVTDDLQEFIFEDLKRKSSEAKNSREACLQRGDLALSMSTIRRDVVNRDVSNYLKLKWSISDFQYAESLLLWHIATEIFCLDKKQTFGETDVNNCKILSDYMFYLLIAKPTMLSPVLRDWHVVFQDTCAEAKRFFKKYSIADPLKALDKIKSTKAKFRAAAVKGTKSKSVFFDACILAQQLMNLEHGQSWEIMNRVWVEFMSYAAINCRPIVHAQQPSRGGELLTFTWLLMNHLGLGTQFSEQEEQPGMKLAAVK